MTSQIVIPRVFGESEEFQSLEAAQRDALVARLGRVASIAESLILEQSFSSHDALLDFVQDLELDVAIAEELEDANRGGLSRWLMHHSWSFDTSPAKMRSSLSKEVLAILDATEPTSDLGIDVFSQWFRNVGSELLVVLREFAAAMTYDAALALHIVVDILLIRILSSCYKLRLSPFVAR